LVHYLTKDFQAQHAVPGDSILIRVFKQEKELEVWVARNGQLVLLKEIPVCAMSGKPGPKRKQGDLQVPEGFYYIDLFNPDSDFYLSFRINYPNKTDLLYADKQNPGGDIYVHGQCASIGCVAIRNPPITWLYMSAWLAHKNGQAEIPVHIFPCRMEQENLRLLYVAFPQNVPFWKSLKAVYDRFEQQPRFISTAD
jgi:murein L,D-transpeptidase YafK